MTSRYSAGGCERTGLKHIVNNYKYSMAKVITLSRTFQSTHPRKGEPTYFVEKVWKSLYVNGVCPDELSPFINQYMDFFKSEKFIGYYDSISKKHTIRAGNRWKDGDMASLRVWSGKPYTDKQIAIAPDIKITVKSVEIKDNYLYVDGKFISNMNHRDVEIVAKNDGLSADDFANWFPKSNFTGQMLIWNNLNLPY